MNQETFDFGSTEAAENSSFLQPGHWILGISGAEYVEPEGTKPDGSPKTPFIKVTLEGKGGKMTDRFFISPKTLGRLQYLHLAWYGKKLDKEFKNAKEVGAYFEKLLNMDQSKKIQKRVVVGGEEYVKDGQVRVKALLPYTGFVIPDEIAEFEEGVFERGSANWMMNVKKQAPNASSSTDAAMLPDSVPSSDDSSDDLPF